MDRVEFKVGDLIHFDYDGLLGKGVIVTLDGDGGLVRLLGHLEGHGHHEDDNYWYVVFRYASKTDNRVDVDDVMEMARREE